MRQAGTNGRQQGAGVGAGSKGTAQHALLVGRTGSGKPTLRHTPITNLALTCSPDAVQLFLLDFKKGVEFQIHTRAQLPHTRVVAIQSEREFGLRVPQGLRQELDQRGALYNAAGKRRQIAYFLRWWLTVGWLMRPSICSTRSLTLSQQQHSRFMISWRVSSARALANRTGSTGVVASV